jgi:hypothetical protein
MCPKNVTVKEEIHSMDSSEKVWISDFVAGFTLSQCDQIEKNFAIW